MKRHLVCRSLGCAVGLLFAARMTFAQRSVADVPPPAKRAAAVELGTRLAKPASPADAAFPATAANPFDPPGYNKPIEEEKPAVKIASAKELVGVLAAQIQAKGTFFRDGQPILITSKKQVKVGEKIPITFENSIYEVEVTDIKTTTFTIKYNEEHITRSTTSSTSPKSGTTP